MRTREEVRVEIVETEKARSLALKAQEGKNNEILYYYLAKCQVIEREAQAEKEAAWATCEAAIAAAEKRIKEARAAAWASIRNHPQYRGPR